MPGGSCEKRSSKFFRHAHHRHCYRRKGSTSNLSSISNTSNTRSQPKTLCLRLPVNFGATLSLEGDVLAIEPDGAAYCTGVIQVGDHLRILDENESEVALRITYGILRLANRPSCPFLIEIGNPNSTSLGIALTDVGIQNSEPFWNTKMENGSKSRIEICSIRQGSLADRCGFLKPGDTLLGIQVQRDNQSKTIPCFPLYSSYQMAQILRHITLTEPTVTLAILPGPESELDLDDDDEEGECQGHLQVPEWVDNIPPGMSKNEEDSTRMISFCLWKDSSFDDWGFSIADILDKESAIVVVHEIRSGGPAFLVGLQTGDQILRINDRVVGGYESTILVPMLASLTDALNLVVLRHKD